MGFLAEPQTCIPFFLLITFVANFMVFNLFIAILLEAFSVDNLNQNDEGAVQEKVQKKKSKAIKGGIARVTELFKEQRKKIRRTLSGKKDTKSTANGDVVVRDPEMDFEEPSSETIREKPTVTFSEEIDENNGGIEISEAAMQSNRDENYLGPSEHDFDARKFSAASVDILIDGLDLKREKEQAIKLKKKKTYNEQE